MEKKQYPHAICENPDCRVDFQPTKPWQTYHSVQCRLNRLSIKRIKRLEARVRELEEYELMYKGLEK